MYKDRIENYKKIEKLRNSKLLIYITGDRPGFETQIHPEVLDYFINHLDCLKKEKKITLLLYTRGGNTLAAWSLTNLIRQFCDDFEVLIPSKAHSSGTLISLGANTIIMTKQATLGPIDPSLNSPLNPQNPQVPNNPQARLPVSVESIKGYFELAKKDLQIKDTNCIANILIGLSNQVHPLVLGDVYRSRTQIQMKDKKQIDKIISFLCSDSGSHDYTIYRREAKEELGLNIEKPNDEFYQIIKETFIDIQNEFELKKAFDTNILLGNNNQADYSCRRALIESIAGGTDVFVSEGTLLRSTQMVQQAPNIPPIQRVVIEDQRKFEGWKHE
jgi:hypothetical protein